MKKLLVAIAAVLCLGAAPAHAQGYQVVPNCGDASPSPGNGPGYMDQNGNLCVTSTATSATLTALPGTQTLTLTTTAQALTVPTGATSATLSVTGGAAVYRDDGTAPTATVGLTLPVGLWTYVGPLSAVKFILPSGVTGTVVTVAFYK